MAYVKKNGKFVFHMIGGKRYYVFKKPTQTPEPEPSSDAFMFTVDTTLGDGDPSMELPLRSGYNYDFIVDWGDGNTNHITSYDQAETDHTYSSGGQYQISISGTCEAWYFNYGSNKGGDKDKLISIDQWGDTGFRKMSSAFRGCSNLTSVNDTGDGSWCLNVVDMDSMFTSNKSLTGTTGLENWNVSNVTNMSHMFNNCESLTNLNSLENWNVSGVTDMSAMFGNNSNLTGLTGLENWNVSGVTDMSLMFHNCTSLTELTSLENWNVSNVTNMNVMFENCSSLYDISDLTNWDVSNVTNMVSMFFSCTSINDISPISNWNIQSIEPHSFNDSMENMFYDCDNITQSTYDDVLNAWAALTNIPTDVRFDIAITHSSNAQTAYDTLVDDYNWTINENFT